MISLAVSVDELRNTTLQLGRRGHGYGKCGGQGWYRGGGDGQGLSVRRSVPVGFESVRVESVREIFSPIGVDGFRIGEIAIEKLGYVFGVDAEFVHVGTY